MWPKEELVETDVMDTVATSLLSPPELHLTPLSQVRLQKLFRRLQREVHSPEHQVRGQGLSQMDRPSSISGAGRILARRSMGLIYIRARQRLAG